MLSSLQIRNFAIIDSVDIELSHGMSVLTGETGAGKSILVDALGLVLGERGGTGLVRDGAKRAEFTARFELQHHEEANHWLAEQMLDLDGECILRRVINADGRSRAFINGNAVPLQSLKTIGEMLVDLPPNLPDLFPVLWSVVGCALFCLAWLIMCVKLTQIRNLSKVKVH